MRTKHAAALWVLLPLLLAGSIVCSLMLGGVSFSVRELYDGICGSNEKAALILWQVRLPRVLGAMMAGAALAPAGLSLQYGLGNPLASPNVVGISSGAGLGTMLILALFPTVWLLLPFAAFLFAVCAAILVAAISFGREKNTVILCGIAISAICNGVLSFLSLRFPDAVASYAAFAAGGFSGLRFSELIVPAIFISMSLFFFILFGARLDALVLGDDGARGVGIRVPVVRAISLILSSLLTGAVVSYAGLIGFVGLLVPNIIRAMYHGSFRQQAILCMLGGALLTTVADLLGRTLFTPSEVPAGVITAFLGGGYFLFLLYHRRFHSEM